MAKRNKQNAYVEGVIRTDGSIARNRCLLENITRLSAIICDMQKRGYVFETSKNPFMTKWGVGYDYVYTVKAKPVDRVYSV